MSADDASWNPKHTAGMLARLWLVPQDGPVQVLVFDALAFNGKRFTLGRGLGHFEADDRPLVSPVAQMIIERGAACCEQRLLELVELREVKRVWPRMYEAITRAEAGSFVMFLCATPQILDATLPFLKVERDAFPGSLHRSTTS